ncbi:MAG: DNA repair protein RecO [Candidatus Humimicrobiaceae bacterium]
MPTYKAKALVLRTYKLGESDKIVRLYCRHQGLVSAVGKGARKTKSRFGGRLELFNLIDAELHVGKSLDIIGQAEIIENFKNIANDFSRFVFCELISKIILKTHNEISEPSESLFKLIYVCFREINSSGYEDIVSLKKIMCFFIAKFLSIAGFGPLLGVCAKCNKKLEASLYGFHGKKILFSVKLGGVLCQDCSMGTEDTGLNAKSFRLLYDFFTKKIEDIRDMEVDHFALKKAYTVLENYIIYHTGCNVSSFQYLKKIGI